MIRCPPQSAIAAFTPENFFNLEFFVVNADLATKAQVNMVSLDLSMAAAQRRHTKGSIGLAYSLLPSRKRGQF